MTNFQRVLIVDDNFDLAENIAEILALDGHLTEVAGSAEDAFPMALKNEPDVVITDYRLPGITGAVFVTQFLRTRTRVHAVVISAYTDEETVRKATDAGATFMAKPIDYQRLRQFVMSSFGLIGSMHAALPC